MIKYLPQYDDVLPQIAKITGECQFVFLTRKKSTPVVNSFRRRLAAAFARHNLSSDDYLVFLPRLDYDAYFSLYRTADIYLDSIGWSGCNTTMDAIACDLPVVTLPGDLMRGRQSMAILEMMGLTTTVADSVDDYVQIAARLGRDARWRTQIREQIAMNKHRLYGDMTPIAALEAFLEKAVEDSRRYWHRGRAA